MVWTRLWAIASFELNRLFLTQRGWVTLGAFALLWFFLFRYGVLKGAELMQSEMFQDMAASAFGTMGFGEIYQWPMAELAVYWLIGIFIFPVLALTLSADQTASDRERGTLRFLVLRSSRAEVLFGRLLGQAMILAFLTGSTLVISWILGGIKQPDQLVAVVPQLVSLWFHLLISLLPFLCLMALLNSFLTSARQSLLLASLILGLGHMMVILVSYYVPVLDNLYYLIPGNDFSSILSQPGSSVQGYLQPVLQTAGLSAIAWFISRRSSL